MLQMKLAVLKVVIVCAVLSEADGSSAGCTYEGKHYETGETFKPSLCLSCHCLEDDRSLCLPIECYVIHCVDHIADPTECCPVCPNGNVFQHVVALFLRKKMKFEVLHPCIY